MEIALITFGLIYVLSLIWNVSTDGKDERFFSVFLLTISAIILVASFSSHKNRNTPTSLDVYEGKTTLEITYRDSIPVDSVVVFKEEFKK